MYSMLCQLKPLENIFFLHFILCYCTTALPLFFYLKQGHTKLIHSVCWDSSGELLASVSEDSVRVWSFGSGSEGECVHELSCNGNKFHSCVFHPTCPSLLVIGCYQASNFLVRLVRPTFTMPVFIMISCRKPV